MIKVKVFNKGVIFRIEINSIHFWGSKNFVYLKNREWANESIQKFKYRICQKELK